MFLIIFSSAAVAFSKEDRGSGGNPSTPQQGFDARYDSNPRPICKQACDADLQ
jgi:hypothetical protein